MNKLKKTLLPLYIKCYNLLFSVYNISYKYYTLYVIPYKYIVNRYEDSFVSNKTKIDKTKLERAEEVIYVFWTGNNDIPPNRLKGIESLKKLSEVEVVLVTPKNLNDYILKDFPLHPAYEYLSFVHRSDYLRGYFMLHYGGGYSDIKPCLRSWKNLFKELNSFDDKWCIAPREKNMGGVPNIKGAIGEDIKKYHNNLISNCTFAYKPNSPLVDEWMDETHKRLDHFLPELKKCTANDYGNEEYPIPWSYIMGQIMHPLVLKYHDRIICKDIDLYSTVNYR